MESEPAKHRAQLLTFSCSDIACTPTGPKGFDGENKSHVIVQAALDPLYQASRPTANDNASAPALAA